MSIKARMIYIYVVLVLAYIATTFLLPPSHTTLAHYHISALQLRLISIILVVPYVLIWLAGFYAYIKLMTYAWPLKHTKDGRHVVTLARGILWLVLWPPVSSLVATWFSFIEQKQPGSTAALTVIDYYLNLVLPLIGFVVIGKASGGLAKLARLQYSDITRTILNIILMLLGVFYTYLVVGNGVVKGFSSFPHLPHWLVLLTVVVPYIYMWFIGLLATYQFNLYRKKVAGMVYRQTWGLLALGTGATIILQIIVEYTMTLLPLFANKLSIGGAILFEYGVLILLAIGYILIALGAKKLQKIEEA